MFEMLISAGCGGGGLKIVQCVPAVVVKAVGFASFVFICKQRG
jgi:hypothetical protein